jgi:hypothetical protein
MSRSWIFTSVANGVFLTFDRFKLHGFDVDECHYTSDAAVVYTYVHFKKQETEARLDLFLKGESKATGFTLFEIFGYESVVKTHTDTSLLDHVGFKILLNHYQTKNPAFVSCTDGHPGIIRGLLWNSDALPRIKEILKQRNRMFYSYFEDMERQLAESKAKESLLELQLAEAEARIHDYAHYQFVYCVLEHRISLLGTKAQKRLLEPDHIGRPIFPNPVFLKPYYDRNPP